MGGSLSVTKTAKATKPGQAHKQGKSFFLLCRLAMLVETCDFVNKTPLSFPQYILMNVFQKAWNIENQKKKELEKPGRKRVYVSKLFLSSFHDFLQLVFYLNSKSGWLVGNQKSRKMVLSTNKRKLFAY